MWKKCSICFAVLSRILTLFVLKFDETLKLNMFIFFLFQNFPGPALPNAVDAVNLESSCSAAVKRHFLPHVGQNFSCATLFMTLSRQKRKNCVLFERKHFDVNVCLFILRFHVHRIQFDLHEHGLSV